MSRIYCANRLPDARCQPRGVRRGACHKAGHRLRHLVQREIILAFDSRSGQITSDHSVLASASTTSATGSNAAGVAAIRRSDTVSGVSATATTHRGTRIEVADVDHGNEMATAAAR